MSKKETKLCKHCKTEIPVKAKICPNCKKKQGGALKWVIIAVIVLFVIGAAAGSGDDEEINDTTNDNNLQLSQSEQDETKKDESEEKQDEEKEKESDSKTKEEKEKYSVGDTYENKTLKVTYTSCYEFTDYNQYNAPDDGNKIICAEFEFENIGSSDTTVMYTDFHGYADGYEMNQSYAPDGTGLDFSVKMSAGRKGIGKVAFEVPEDAEEIEIEFSPNFWTSENVIFIYQ